MWFLAAVLGSTALEGPILFPLQAGKLRLGKAVLQKRVGRASTLFVFKAAFVLHAVQNKEWRHTPLVRKVN